MYQVRKDIRSFNSKNVHHSIIYNIYILYMFNHLLEMTNHQEIYL